MAIRILVNVGVEMVTTGNMVFLMAVIVMVNMLVRRNNVSINIKMYQGQ